MHPREIERWLNPDWRARLLAWWEGYDLSTLQKQARVARQGMSDRRFSLRQGGVGTHADAVAASTAAAGAGAVAAGPPMTPEEAEEKGLEGLQLDRRGWPVWSVERVRGAQMLWGEGFTAPGDAHWMVDAVRPFGLNPSKSVLDLAAGLGGVARAIVNAFDTWVTGLEPSPLLARMAMRRSQIQGMDRKAPVIHYDPEHFRPAGSYDLVLADRIMHRVRDKDFFLDNVADCLKPKGSALFMDYVIEGTPDSWDSWNAWKEEEPTDLFPWTTKRMTDELTQRNLDVRIGEDLTQIHRAQVLERVRQLSERIEHMPPDGRLFAGLARELALWWARLQVLGRGLSFYRFVALKPA
ncbi:SAM-dependent methyltransferase [Azospirillum fermentarium]|uniref:class I SAM-dependent methyltransferase n=1 Tax=Azospirillum fermentarium TaxID=1233114 RepID=UPI0022264324|nr:class I SAM-dependent methyltransferase [Azospirillum fermentarium]MCW2247160.1 SAM-dependent methyltransferase [Azospirillum fermentarium]